MALTGNLKLHVCVCVFIVHTLGVPSQSCCCLGTLGAQGLALCAEATWALQGSGSCWSVPVAPAAALGCAGQQTQPRVVPMSLSYQLSHVQHPWEVFCWKLGDVYGI